MTSQKSALEKIREHASLLLESLEIRRIVIVDDEYATEEGTVEDFIGLCLEFKSEISSWKSLQAISFDADPDIWAEQLRIFWKKIDSKQRDGFLQRARSLVKERDQPEWDVISNNQESDAETRGSDEEAAKSLQNLLEDLPGISFRTLSLGQWEAEKENFLEPLAEFHTTLFLFDRNFNREGQSEDAGIALVKEVLKSEGHVMCGLITHTVPVGGEFNAWKDLSSEYKIDKHRFLVIAKQRLTGESPTDYSSFLEMVRLAALTDRCTSLKNSAWNVFKNSMNAATIALEKMDIRDFDQMVFASSRREGVLETDTFFRIFSILMRLEARKNLYKDESGIPAEMAKVRKVSVISNEIKKTIGNEPRSLEAIRVHQFEIYERAEFLNKHHFPIDLGDIFEDGNQRQYILLCQPCDMMVRTDGKRSPGKKSTACVNLVELVVERPKNLERSVEIPWFQANTGLSMYADFAKSHHVSLAVLDLCVFHPDGRAVIHVGQACPDGVMESWKKHHKYLEKIFCNALKRFHELERKQVKKEQKALMLPIASSSSRFKASVEGNTVHYDVKRVRRLNQPRSGALLTKFAQFISREAFEHDLGRTE